MVVGALWVAFLVVSAILYSLFHSWWLVLFAFGVFAAVAWLISRKNNDNVTLQENEDSANRQ